MKNDILDKPDHQLESQAEAVAELLNAMANPKRLVVLCSLLENERCVGDLAEIVNLSVPALSQHLGKMRLLGLVDTRREGQLIYYRLASDKVRTVLETLYRVYCAPQA
jgi:ArsR family transcriptional regulator, virulence genes transcriptional regulator